MQGTSNYRDSERSRNAFPAAYGEVVQQRHADLCATQGHARWISDGEDTGRCGRCGDVTGPVAPIGAVTSVPVTRETFHQTSEQPAEQPRSSRPESGSAALLLVAQLAAVATAVGVASVTLSDAAHSSQLEQLPAVSRHVDACATDEGSDGQGSRPCVWDARHLGNGSGASFIVRRDGRIQRISHARAHAFIWGAL